MTESAGLDQMLERMCGEYLEMPGLRLTCQQAQRLWGLDGQTCIMLLNILLDVGFLRQTPDGTFVRTTDGPTSLPSLRMARADLTPRAVAANRDATSILRAAGAGARQGQHKSRRP